MQKISAGNIIIKGKIKRNPKKLSRFVNPYLQICREKQEEINIYLADLSLKRVLDSPTKRKRQVKKLATKDQSIGIKIGKKKSTPTRSNVKYELQL